jgi:AcrR family transcriptional regulator
VTGIPGALRRGDPSADGTSRQVLFGAVGTETHTRRPRRETSAAQGERVNEILDIAASLFSTRGYSGTTMNDIADVAGVLPGSLYHHFDSKAAIAVILLEGFREDLKSSVAEIRRTGPADDPVAAISDLSRAMSRLSRRHRAAIRLRAYEAPTTDSAQMSASLRARVPALNALWADYIGALAETAQVRSDIDPGLLRFAFQYLTLNAGRTEDDPDSYAADVSNLLLHGVLATDVEDDELGSSPAHDAVRAVMRDWNAEVRQRSTDQRSLIIDAAREQFSLHGYESTTIRDVASAAGVPMGSLYRRVESKAMMLEEILTTYSTALSKGVEAALSTPGTSRPQALDALSLLLVQASRTWRHENRIARFEWSHQGDPIVETFYDETLGRLKRLEKLIRAGQQDGEIASDMTPRRLAPALRTAFWLPFQEHGNTSRSAAHVFIRQTVLRGALIGS